MFNYFEFKKIYGIMLTNVFFIIVLGRKRKYYAKNEWKEEKQQSSYYITNIMVVSIFGHNKAVVIYVIFS